MGKRVVDFNRLLDARPATCVDCGKEGRVDRWTYRDAYKQNDILMCKECGGEERDGNTYRDSLTFEDTEMSPPKAKRKGLPQIGADLKYKGDVYPWSVVPDDLRGKPATESNLRKLAEVLDDEEPK